MKRSTFDLVRGIRGAAPRRAVRAHRNELFVRARSRGLDRSFKRTRVFNSTDLWCIARCEGKFGTDKKNSSRIP